MFDYKIIAYNKLGKVQETENLYCAPDEINDVMYTMSEQYGYAEALTQWILIWVSMVKDLFHLVKEDISNCYRDTHSWDPILYNKYIHHKTNFKIMLPQVQRISERILKVDNFENVAHVCCDWEEFVFEVAEWGVDHICGVDFDDLSDEAIKELDSSLLHSVVHQVIHTLVQ